METVLKAISDWIKELLTAFGHDLKNQKTGTFRTRYIAGVLFLLMPILPQLTDLRKSKLEMYQKSKYNVPTKHIV